MSGDVNSRLGARLGPRIAMLVHQAIIHAHTQLSAVKHKLAMAIFHSISDMISGEVHQSLDPIMKMLHEGLPDESPAKPAVQFMHTQTGQLQALAGTGLQASGLLNSISTIMNNELAPAVYANVFTNPHMLPDVGTIAQLVATGRIAPALGYGAIASQGIDNGWAANIISLAQTLPSVTDGLEMLRRGIITTDQFSQYAIQNGVPAEVVPQFLAMKDQPLSPADAALAVLRGNISQADGEAIAAENGIDPTAFGVIIGNTGEPPGLEQLLEGYRRGFIDQATLTKGILQSRYRDEWVPFLTQLRYQPMSTADAVNATVQNQLDAATAEAISQQNGLEPGSFATLLATAGEPLSRTEMEDLYNRGVVTKDDVIQALRESRLKNKYNEWSFDLHAKLLPVSEMQRAVLYGTMPEATAVANAMKLGYSKEDATALIESGIAVRVEDARKSVITAMQSLYEIGAMSPSDLEGGITGLGYSDKQARFIVEASEFHREQKLLALGIRAIRTKYLSRHIDRTTASGLIDKLGIPASGRDYMLSTWDVEAQGYTTELTTAQILKALKLELITVQEAGDRLIAKGYNQADAQLLLNGA